MELQRRMDEAGINGISISVNPGIVRTNSSRYFFDSFSKKLFLTLTLPFQWLLMKSSFQGAQTSLFGCLADEDKIEKGLYYADCKLATIDSKQGKDVEAGKILW